MPLSGPDDTIPSLSRHAKFGPRLTKIATAYTLFMAAYKTYEKYKSKYEARISHSVTVRADDLIYDDLHEWLLEQLPEQERRSLTARTSTSSSSPEVSLGGNSTEEKPLVNLYYDSSNEQKVDIEGHQITVSLVDDAPSGLGSDIRAELTRKQFTFLKFRAKSPEGRDVVLRLLERLAREHSSSPKVARIKTTTRWGSWKNASGLRPRRWDSVIMANGLAESVRDDLKTFLESEEEYVRRSLPYHRGYLLEGPPGVGKSSLVQALATEFNLDLWIIPLNDLDSDTSIMDLVSEISDGILLMEDIDVFSAATDREAEKGSVSLSSLLNALDGVSTPHGLITFMTTNNLDAIDPALYRPGRIDMVLKIEEADFEQVGRMLDNWFGKEEGVDWVCSAEFRTRKWNPAKVQEILRNTNTLDEAIEELFGATVLL